jgi:hypothetical protein
MIHKTLKRSAPLHALGSPPDSIQSYVVAYECHQNISTVVRWLPQISSSLRTKDDKLVDMIVILGKGVIWKASAFASIPVLNQTSGVRWVYFNRRDQNLFMLFIHMLTWASYLSSPPSVLGYVSRVFFDKIKTI